MSKRLCWVTDIHLNFLDEKKLHSFFMQLFNSPADAILITGDIAEAPNVEDYMKAMAITVDKPVYFVLGNHDFYRGSIGGVSRAMNKYTEGNKFESNLCWLNEAGVVRLTEKTALVGHHGWWDGRYADPMKSDVWMNDYEVINEFSGIVSYKFMRAMPPLELKHRKEQLYAVVRKFADEAASALKANMLKAASVAESVIVGVHIPPFRESATYRGQISDDHWMPHFSSKVIGDVLLEVAGQHQDKTFTVFCGHSHGEAFVKPLSNLSVYTGEAEYRFPQIQRVITVG